MTKNSKKSKRRGLYDVCLEILNAEKKAMAILEQRTEDFISAIQKDVCAQISRKEDLENIEKTLKPLRSAFLRGLVTRSGSMRLAVEVKHEIWATRAASKSGRRDAPSLVSALLHVPIKYEKLNDGRYAEINYRPSLEELEKIASTKRLEFHNADPNKITQSGGPADWAYESVAERHNIARSALRKWLSPLAKLISEEKGKSKNK